MPNRNSSELTPAVLDLLPLVLLVACATPRPESDDALRGAAEDLEVERPTDELPAPAAPPITGAERVDALLARLSEATYTHGQERSTVEALDALCQTDCAPVLAAAMDRARTPLHHAALWWALSDPPPRPYREIPPFVPRDPEMEAQIATAARATLLDPTETPEIQRAAARALLRPVVGPDRKVTASEAGAATLNALLRSDADVFVRAAAACALFELGEVPPKLVDAALLEAFELCHTPWSYGQQEVPPDPG